MSDEIKILNALHLASVILDTCTENTDTDIMARDIARSFIKALSPDEDVIFENVDKLTNIIYNINSQS